ncbi:MAG: RNA polymerase sigma factor [Fibrobacteres bacterium]|nr:RNA polymerase sigma factor [Fibrobacterota bacterium]
MTDLEFNSLVDKHGKKVYNLAFRITGSREDAEDIAQETFLQIFNCYDKFRRESDIFTWIYKITFNCALKYKSKLTKEYVESLDEKIELLKDDIPEEVRSWYSTPEQDAYIGELLKEIRHGCMHFLSFILPENQRIVYVMRNVLDFSHKEISDIIGLDENVIKVRLNRARNSLLQYFSKRCQWITKDSTCSCKSRIGFALAYDPEILKRVKAHAHDVGIVSSRELESTYSANIDELYQKFPELEYWGSNSIKKS